MRTTILLSNLQLLSKKPIDMTTPKIQTTAVHDRIELGIIQIFQMEILFKTANLDDLDSLKLLFRRMKKSSFRKRTIFNIFSYFCPQDFF